MILTFHAIEDGPAAVSYPPRLFARGMAVLRDLGYRTIGLEEWVGALRSGGPLPSHSFVLTFDDGYRSLHAHLGPLLESFGWTATLFLTVGEEDPEAMERPARLFGRSLLNWEEIADLRRVGARFGAHSLTHPDLTRLPLRRAEIEVVRSKAVIERRLGTAVTAFAYPFGRHDTAIRGIVRDHFDCACTDRLGIAGPGSDPFALERIDAHYLRHERLFAALASKWLPLYIAVRAAPRRLKRAVSSRAVGP